MSVWNLLILLPSVFAVGYPRYECGENGRFEYCIDGNPGCIVGCHCHPGYYFDTETKICEPNAKLVEEYRRLYVAEPTRISFTLSPSLSELGPTPTTTTPSGPDSVTRDTDDLGDWLYNQFFKTIETQVINNTDKSNILTRRSGGDDVHIKNPKIKKRRKKSKNSSKKAKKKNDDLRRKLLRISEDDSMFDSSESSSSSSSSSESNSGEVEGVKIQDDRDKTHRKFILMNKKPRMPLPSFIFMPNYQTPFYPPIGLPPPQPPFPMFPMVPVPPMMPPPFPQPVPPPCDSTTKEADKISSTTESTTKPPDDHTKKEDDSKEKNDKKEEKEEKKEEEVKPDEESKSEDSSKKEEETVPDDQEKKPEDADKATDEANRKKFIRNRNNKHGKRNKILHQLRERMRPPHLKLNTNSPIKKKKKVLRNHFMNVNEPVNGFAEDYNLEPYVFKEPAEKPADEPLVPGGDDVNFKYLAQLIHRADPALLSSKDVIQNKMKAMENPEVQMGEKFQPIPINRPTRRFNGNRYLTRAIEPDDAYYSNLGQQIASLIRKLDSTGQRQVDIEVNRKPVGPGQPVFNENNYASRSYWERSVRSPLNNIQSETDEYYPQTNYQNLYNLENKFEIVATTERTLSLNDLENVVVLMDRAKASLEDKSEDTKNTKKSRGNFNVSLLPRQKERLVNSRKNNHLIDHIDRNNVKPKNKTIISEENNNTHLNPYLNGVLMNNFKPVLPDINVNDLLMSNFRSLNNLNLMLPRNQNQTNIKINNALPQKIDVSLQRRNYSGQPRDAAKLSPMYAHKLARNPESYMYPVKKLQSIIHQLIPLQKNTYKNTKYYTDENKNYMYEKQSIPFHLPNERRNLKPITRPSYFHHEFHHFDYFD